MQVGVVVVVVLLTVLTVSCTTDARGHQWYATGVGYPDQLAARVEPDLASCSRITHQWQWLGHLGHSTYRML